MYGSPNTPGVKSVLSGRTELKNDNSDVCDDAIEVDGCVRTRGVTEGIDVYTWLEGVERREGITVSPPDTRPLPRFSSQTSSDYSPTLLPEIYRYSSLP